MNPSERSRYMAATSWTRLTRLFNAQIFSIVFLTTIAASSAQASEDLSLQPSPTLTPQEVVTFQLLALKQDSAEGISATFRFASPANRKITGPLTRFSQLFDSPHYQPMLNNRGTEVKLISNDGLNAELLAGVVDWGGELRWYSFRLSRQSEAPYENCWMTDAVLSVPHQGDSA